MERLGLMGKTGGWRDREKSCHLFCYGPLCYIRLILEEHRKLWPVGHAGGHPPPLLSPSPHPRSSCIQTWAPTHLSCLPSQDAPLAPMVVEIQKTKSHPTKNPHKPTVPQNTPLASPLPHLSPAFFSSLFPLFTSSPVPCASSTSCSIISP